MHLSLLPPALGLACALAGLVIGLLLLGTHARGSHAGHRVFPLLAFCAAAYALCYFVATLDDGKGWLNLLCARVQIVAAGGFALALLRYTDIDLGAWPTAWRRTAMAPVVAGVLLYQAGQQPVVDYFRIEWLQYDLYNPRLSLAGQVGLLLLSLGLAPVLARYAAAAWRGVPDAGAHLAAFGVVSLAGGVDALSAGGAIAMVDTAPTAFTVTVLLMARVVARRWRADIDSLEELRDRFEQRAEERGRLLVATQERLARSERLAAVGRLAGGLAHAINNPGAAVVANLEYLAKAIGQGGPPPETGEVVQESLQAARRLTSTVRRLMVFGRAASADDAGGSFDLAEAVERALRPFGDQAGDRVEVVARVHPGIAVRGRGMLLEQALGEVLQNALHAAPADAAVIRLAAARERGKVLLRVSDNGSGMTPEVLANLFEPFSTFRPDGGEVGLAMVLGLLRALGGDVEVDSAPGRGSTFTFVLEPAAQGARGVRSGSGAVERP